MERIKIANDANGERIVVERDFDTLLMRFLRESGTLIAEIPFSVFHAADDRVAMPLTEDVVLNPRSLVELKIWARLNTEPTFDDTEAIGLDTRYGPYSWADLEVVKGIWL